MKQRYVGFGVLVIAAGLAACGGGSGGGGGGGGGTAPPTPGSSPPTASYAGSETITNVYNGYPCGASCGDPTVTPYPKNSVTYSLSDAVTSSNGGSTVVVTQTEEQPNEELTSSTTVLVTPSPNGAAENITETRTVYSDSDGYLQTITYPTALVVDEEPETNGAHWTNTAAKDTSESYNDGTRISRTTNVDGTYVETEINSNDYIDDTATVNADASGSWIAAPESYGFLGGYYTGYTWTAPAGGNVTFTGTEYNSDVSQITVPAFFPTTQPIVASNTSDSSTITTGVTFPGGCSVPAMYGTSGNDVHRVVQSLDPLFGFTETTTTDAYTSATYGLVCLETTDVLNTYYDWNLDEAYFLDASDNGEPFIVTTTTSTLTLQSGNGVGVLSSAQEGAVAQTLARAETTAVSAQAKKRVLSVMVTRSAKGAV